MTSLSLAYGKEGLALELDDAHYDVTTILPHDVAALPDPKSDFMAAAAAPIGAPALASLARDHASDQPSVCIVIADHTRPVPDNLLVPWIVEALGVNDEQVTVLIGTGTHRGSRQDEIDEKLGADTAKRFTIINHDCMDPDLIHVGDSPCGGECWLNPAYVNADIKIVTGFIEPHFMAGFSGGSKGICPGVAGFKTVQHFHRAQIIADPASTWGDLENNPLQKLTRSMVSHCPPDVMVNVTLNLQKAITGMFVGHFIEAHRIGAKQALAESMIEVPDRFPVVITTNSGYPLDQNFYQTVKGISAAHRIVKPGGHIIAASHCGEGLPDEGDFSTLLQSELSTADLLADINGRTITQLDQWQVQIHLRCLNDAHVHLYSTLPEDKAKHTRCHITTDIAATLAKLKADYGDDPMPVAVMPRGPLTIPTVPQLINA